MSQLLSSCEKHLAEKYYVVFMCLWNSGGYFTEQVLVDGLSFLFESLAGSFFDAVVNTRSVELILGFP